jgi:hypothetical protein
MVLTTTYLWKFSNASRTSLSQLMKMMLEDGVMYFVALCCTFKTLRPMSPTADRSHSDEHREHHLLPEPQRHPATRRLDAGDGSDDDLQRAVHPEPLRYVQLPTWPPPTDVVFDAERASRDGISGEGTHSSRTPANPRGGNTVGASGADDVIAVRVMKSVITMNDMSRDDASESKAKGTAHGQWSVDEMA